MTTTHVRPRFAERLLESLGARDGLRDDVIGDLAQELAERTARDGERQARWWHVRECVRAMPCLLHSWWSGLRPRDVARIVAVPIVAWVLLAVAGTAILAVAAAIAWIAGISVPAPSALSLPVVWTISTALAIVTGSIGGYTGAWLHRRAELIGAFSVGVTWSTVNALASFAAQVPPPLWVRIGFPALLLTGAVIGGTVRVVTSAAASTTPAGGL